MTRVAVVGAGPAGLMAARRVTEAGVSVTVFDKGRRPGGRTNTREHGAYRFDHGAQFFTVRDDRVRPLLDAWLSQGVVRRWEGNLVHLTDQTVAPARPGDRYVGTPGMIRIAEALAEGLDVRSGVRIESIGRHAGRWLLRDDAGEAFEGFDQVIVAVPAPQAVPLLSEAPTLRAMAEQVRMVPAWAGMFVFGAPPPLDFDGAFVADAAFTWLARDASKPGRPDAESWVVHAGPEWTRRHWEIDRSDIPDLLRTELAARFGPLPETVFARAHRWGYARATKVALGDRYDARTGIGVAGDWCVGGRVEGALTSGIDIAEQLLGTTG